MNRAAGRNRHSTEPFHYRHRSFLVGLFIVLPVAVVVGVLAHVFIDSALPGSRIDVYARYQEGQGVRTGASVNYKDVKIGYVKSVALDETGDIVVGMRVKNEFVGLLHKNSWAKVVRKSMVADPVVELGGGSEEAEPPTDGDTLVPIPLASLDRNLQGLAERGEELLADINQGRGTLGKFVKEDSLAVVVQEIAVELKELILMVQHTVGRVDRMAGSYETLSGKLGHMIDSVGTVLSGADAVIADFGLWADRLDSLTVDARPLPARLDTVLTHLDEDLKEAETLLKGLQEHGLLRRAVRRAKQKAAVSDAANR